MVELMDLSSIFVTISAQTTLQWTELPEAPGSWRQQEQGYSAKGDELGVGGNHSTGTVNQGGCSPTGFEHSSAGC